MAVFLKGEDGGSMPEISGFCGSQTIAHHSGQNLYRRKVSFLPSADTTFSALASTTPLDPQGDCHLDRKAMGYYIIIIGGSSARLDFPG